MRMSEAVYDEQRGAVHGTAVPTGDLIPLLIPSKATVKKVVAYSFHIGFIDDILMFGNFEKGEEQWRTLWKEKFVQRWTGTRK